MEIEFFNRRVVKDMLQTNELFSISLFHTFYFVAVWRYASDSAFASTPEMVMTMIGAAAVM
jgi:hypothetical protein